VILKRFITGSLEVNSYLIEDEVTKEAAIIDTGYYEPELAKYVKKQGLEVKYIVLTHGHGDHMCGVPSYKKKYPNIQVVAHQADADLLLGEIHNFSKEISGKFIAIKADRYVNDNDTMTLGNIKLKFIHTPGHTKGSMSILIDNYLFSGDTLFYEAIGRTDFPDGSSESLLKSVEEKLFTLPDNTLVFPGHMRDTNIGHEKQNNPFFKNK